MQELLKTEARAAADPDARREQAGGGIAGLRALAGVGVSAVGALVVLAVIVVHQGLALPLSELPARPGLWPGLLTTGGGLVVMYTSRQTRRAPSKPEPPARAASPANAKPEASEQ